MAFTHKARKARRQANQGRGKGMVYIMLEGERAALQGHGLEANPYHGGTEESELWVEGWEDGRTIALERH